MVIHCLCLPDLQRAQHLNIDLAYSVHPYEIKRRTTPSPFCTTSVGQTGPCTIRTLRTIFWTASTAPDAGTSHGRFHGNRVTKRALRPAPDVSHTSEQDEFFNLVYHRHSGRRIQEYRDVDLVSAMS